MASTLKIINVSKTFLRDIIDASHENDLLLLIKSHLENYNHRKHHGTVILSRKTPEINPSSIK